MLGVGNAGIGREIGYSGSMNRPFHLTASAGAESLDRTYSAFIIILKYDIYR